MSWQTGHNGFSFVTGNGIHRKQAIGPTVNYGPEGQRFILKYNSLSSFGAIQWINRNNGYNGALYEWVFRNEENDSFEGRHAATEQDWQQGWQLGPHQPIDEEWHTPEEVAEALQEPPAPTLSFLNDNRTEITAAVVVAAIVLIVIIWKK